ncbi:hypothetical protein L249_3380 [Ophiocordyceps polyrhachis-furcata BCC 54312]|uniref:Uncharacterized protein n=1 Tax=Ophiocordyceps polyrhachis-furcata BCC 54312 TaxID=1330021 RepID=A0A367LMQ0_9HYPO|nr:hypothetical protein L249_3380 [Ophiocordyceps polyrhachis-furcata BCC 54312]
MCSPAGPTDPPPGARHGPVPSAEIALALALALSRQQGDLKNGNGKLKNSHDLFYRLTPNKTLSPNQPSFRQAEEAKSQQTLLLPILRTLTRLGSARRRRRRRRRLGCGGGATLVRAALELKVHVGVHLSNRLAVLDGDGQHAGAEGGEDDGGAQLHFGWEKSCCWLKWLRSFLDDGEQSHRSYTQPRFPPLLFSSPLHSNSAPPPYHPNKMFQTIDITIQTSSSAHPSPRLFRIPSNSAASLFLLMIHNRNCVINPAD